VSTTYINGQPWRQQYPNNEEILANITGWAAGPSLPLAFRSSPAIVTKNRVYLLGGYTTVPVATVYTAPINEDGTLGTWATGTSLPGVFNDASSIVTKNRVYLFAGVDASGVSATVYTAPINEDGTLGTWTIGPSLPGILRSSAPIVTKNRVYLLGGYTTASVATVYTAPINEDGTLGTWAVGTSLPGILRSSAAIVTKNRVYLLGGLVSAAVATVYTAPINEDGTLGAWTTGPSLPGVLHSSSQIVTKNRVYLLGGYTTASVATVYTAPINEDGTLGTWAVGTSLPGNFSYSSVIVTSSKVYLLAGVVSAAVSTVYVATFPGGKNDYSADSYITIVGQWLNAAVSQPYSMFSDATQVASEQPYGIADGLDEVALLQLYSMVMEVWLTQHYGDVPLIGKALVQPYGAASVLNKSLLQRWGHAPELAVSLEQPWSMPDLLQAVSEQPYGIVAEVLEVTCEQLYNINELTGLFASLIQPYALAGEAARLYQFDTRLYINGERIPYHSLEWQQVDSECAWSCDFAIKDQAVAMKCVEGAAIMITSCGDTWLLRCYDGWFEDRRHGSTVYRVSGFSRTRDLDLATPLLGDLPGGMASALVADLAAPHGITVDWQMADGYLAAGTVTANDETPLAVIRDIVHDARGIILATMDGNLLVVAAEETAIPDWPTVEPADTIIARLERISTSEQRDEQKGYNRFIVSDQLASAGGFRWEEVAIDGSTKEVRLFVVPFDPARQFYLGHSGGTDVSIEPFGLRSLTIPDEQVEFVAGAGKTTKPIYGVSGYAWQKADLGLVIPAEDCLLTASTPGYSLLSITYLTQFYRWIVRDPNIEDVQFIFHEVTP